MAKQMPCKCWSSPFQGTRPTRVYAILAHCSGRLQTWTARQCLPGHRLSNVVDDGTYSRTTSLSERAAVDAGFFAIAFVNSSSFVEFVVRRCYMPW